MIKKIFPVFFICIILIVLGLFWWLSTTSPVDSKNTEQVDFTITSGQAVQIIAQNLEDQGLIKNSDAFLMYVRFTGLGNKIQAGNYKLTTAMTTPQIANQLTHGVNDIWIKVIEGWRVEEIAEYLNNNFGISENEFQINAEEGYMFPDSYRISAKTTGTEIANLMRANFNNKVSKDIISKAGEQGLSLHEVITLASILEREVKSAADRPIVAGIYLKRLREGWPLQADATVQYALGYSNDEKTWWKKGLTFDDLKINSPYNTYIVTGLPPAPIANPGIATIKAVINPTETEYWYYISDDSGRLHYATTIEEHEDNIAKYLR